MRVDDKQTGMRVIKREIERSEGIDMYYVFVVCSLPCK